MRRGVLTLAVLAGALVVLLRVAPAQAPPHTPSTTGGGASRPDAPAGHAGSADAAAPVDAVPEHATPAVVASITDGDTLRVNVDGRNVPVRLLELDAPEVDGACGAAEATAALSTLAPVGTTVWLEPDVERRDRYGRLLRYVWRADGTMVNRALVRRGWARARLYPPNDGHWRSMRRAGARARRRGAGLWRRCGWADAVDPAPAAPGILSAPGPCDPNYSGCVPRFPPDVDCSRVDGPVTVLGADPHHLDGDGDRRACEPPPG